MSRKIIPIREICKTDWRNASVDRNAVYLVSMRRIEKGKYCKTNNNVNSEKFLLKVNHRLTNDKFSVTE